VRSNTHVGWKAEAAHRSVVCVEDGFRCRLRWTDVRTKIPISVNFRVPSQMRRQARQSKVAISSCFVCCACDACTGVVRREQAASGLVVCCDGTPGRLSETLSGRLHRLSQMLHVQPAQHTRLASVREARMTAPARHMAVLPIPRQSHDTCRRVAVATPMAGSSRRRLGDNS
jgi:hypothetical protein